MLFRAWFVRSVLVTFDYEKVHVARMLVPFVIWFYCQSMKSMQNSKTRKGSCSSLKRSKDGFFMKYGMLVDLEQINEFPQEVRDVVTNCTKPPGLVTPARHPIEYHWHPRFSECSTILQPLIPGNDPKGGPPIIMSKPRLDRWILPWIVIHDVNEKRKQPLSSRQDQSSQD